MGDEIYIKTLDEFNTLKAGDKPLVVDFTATWCGPCRTSMPHLSELQQKYKDQGVDVIGIAVWEREPTAQAKIDKVSEFLTSGDWPEKTKYTLAVDKDDMMANGYMKASGQGGIPTAFIVGKDGKIEWIGHPMSMDEPLAQVVAGNWDRAAAKAQREREKAAQREAARLAREERAREARAAAAKAAADKLGDAAKGAAATRAQIKVAERSVEPARRSCSA